MKHLGTILLLTVCLQGCVKQPTLQELETDMFSLNAEIHAESDGRVRQQKIAKLKNLVLKWQIKCQAEASAVENCDLRAENFTAIQEISFNK